MDEGVVEGGEDVGDAEDVLALAHGRAEGDVLLLGLPCLLPPGHGGGGGDGDGGRGEWRSGGGGGGGDKTLAQGTAAGVIRFI